MTAQTERVSPQVKSGTQISVKLKNLVQTALVVALLALGAATMIFPFFWMIRTSLLTSAQLYAFPPPLFPNPARLANYADAVRFMTPRVFFNTVYITGATTFLIILLTMANGFAFGVLQFPFRDKIFLLYMASVMIPFQVSMIPAFLITAELGWVDTYWGLIVPPLGGVAVLTFWFRQFFRSVPRDLYDAAKIDGANPVQAFRYVFAPLARAPVAAQAVLSALAYWNSYLWPLIVTNKPEMQVLTIAIAKFNWQFASANTAILLAGVTLSMLPMFLIYVFGQARIVAGITMTGGLKG